MTHLFPDGGAASQQPSMLSQATPTRPAPSHPALLHPLNRQMLMPKIVHRRARLAELETEMVAACEAAALGERCQTGATSRHEHWNRTTWHRYLATAMRLEATYGPPMRRLRQEIGQLERLIALRIAA
jgi:hypothetical protein